MCSGYQVSSVDVVSKDYVNQTYIKLLFERFPLVAGSIGLVWFVLWAFVMYNSPSEHPWISAEERHYLESVIGTVDNQSMEPTPWFKIMTSSHVWAIAIAHFCYNWAEYTLLTCMPTYLADIGILQGTNVGWLKGVSADIIWFASIGT